MPFYHLGKDQEIVSVNKFKTVLSKSEFLILGMRFGLMQTKVGLTALLQNYKFSVNNKTQEPLKLKGDAIISAAEGEIWLNAKKI